MKKIYTVLTAVIFISISAHSQYNIGSNAYQANNGVLLEHSSKEQMNILGNPVKDLLTLQISNPDAKQYELSLYSSNGTKVTTVVYNHPSGVSTKTISVSQFQRGMYFLVATSKTERRSLQVLLQ